MSGAATGTRPHWTVGRQLASRGESAGERALLPRLLLALISGGLLAVAFPPVGWWPLAVPAVTLLVLACRGLGARRGALVGLVHGLALFVPLLTWMRIIGTDAWLMLSLLEAAYVAGLGALLAVTSRLRLWPLWAACLWVAQELARDTTPFGGFPWGRLAFAETDSPLTPYAALGGAPLVTFATALAGALLAAAVVHRRRARLATAALAVGLAVVLGGLLVPTPVDGPRTTAAVVQGNVPQAGLDFQGEREQVLRNHASATERLAADVDAGRTDRPELVIWPENASDIDPFRDRGAFTRIDDAVASVGVPVLVGAVLQGPGPQYVRNTGIVWDPETGPGERYVKRHPVPFGEYIPFRAQLSGLIERLDQIPRDFFAGDRPGVLQVGPARVGDVICFEIAYDGLVRDVVAGGADLLVVQTNNATYNGTPQPEQQLAMSRLRAVEHGRSVLVAATSGISAVVRPDGGLVERTGELEARTLVADVPLRTATTVADRLGAAPEWLLAGLGLAAAAAALLGARRSGRA